MHALNQMNAAPRHAASGLRSADLPTGPGVYAWYRDGEAVYVGKATGREGIRQRAWKNHMAKGRGAMSGSAFRRNVAEHLGFSTAGAIKANTAVLTPQQVERVNDWIRECDVAWVETPTADEALALERTLKAAMRPTLTKR